MLNIGGEIIVVALCKAYRLAVAHRLRRRRWFGAARGGGPLRRVAERLPDVRLARLFVEAQFAAMPHRWCLAKFGRPYPPMVIVCGGRCWERYQEYVERGISTPAVGADGQRR